MKKLLWPSNNLGRFGNNKLEGVVVGALSCIREEIELSEGKSSKTKNVD